MNTQHDELTRLVAEEPITRTAPDLATIRSAGRRIRTRRRVASGLATLAVLGAIGVPTALAASGGPEATTPAGPASGREPGAASATPTPAPTASATTAPTPFPTETPTSLQDLVDGADGKGGQDTEPPVCGVMACSHARAATHDAERGTVLGEVLPMGTFQGRAEVLYAARVRGTDLRTGKAADVDVLMAGLDDAGTIRRTVWALQPGTEPTGQPLAVYGGTRSADEDGDGSHYGVIGYVKGEHDLVEVTLPDGSRRPVTGSSTAVLRGWTVFHDTGAWLDAWLGDRAPLTYGVPGGPSCLTTECGVVG